MDQGSKPQMNTLTSSVALLEVRLDSWPLKLLLISFNHHRTSITDQNIQRYHADNRWMAKAPALLHALQILKVEDIQIFRSV